MNTNSLRECYTTPGVQVIVSMGSVPQIMGPLYIEGKLMLQQDGEISLFFSASRLAVFPSDPPVPDFSDTPISVTIPANRRSFTIPTFFTINDDNLDEYEQSFAIVAEIGPDVPDGVSCFQNADIECQGRRGATEIRITDNDRKLSF